MNRLLIVIVNYRTGPLVIDCLQSLCGDLTDGRVVVVDNNSKDGSAQQIQAAIIAEGWGEWASVVPLDQNPGFGGGNNVAIRAALSERQPPAYILLLNSDTIVRRGAIRRLVEFLDAHPAIGIAGARLEHRNGEPQRSAFRFPSIAGEFESTVRMGLASRLLKRSVVAPPIRNTAHLTDWVAGACMLVRREVFADIGLFDESYFLYFEEVDFCLQARRAGWECWYVPEARVVHLVGQSTGVTDARGAPHRRPAYWFDSRRRYFRKNYARGYAFLANVAWTMGIGLWRLRRLLQRKPSLDPPYFFWDFFRHHFLPSRFRGAT